MRSVAVIPGDGIGPEVTDQALRTLESLDAELEFDVLDHINAATYLRTGIAMTEEDMARIAGSDALLFGAIGDPRITSPDYARGILLRLRLDLDLYVNHRPATLLHERLSPLRNNAKRMIDCTIIRENTEGIYAGVGGTLRPDTPAEIAIDEDVNTYRGVSRVIDYAFQIAGRSVCMVDKSNVVRFGGRLWQRCWREALARHAEISTSHLYVDAAAMKLVDDPTAFDVIVTNNSYGDILSDLTAQLAGGLGLSASANLNPETGFGLFEPVHGSAPDIAGEGLANPIGAVLSGAMLVEHLGYKAAAAALRGAVREVIEENQCTRDLGGSLRTEQAGAAIRAALG
jgi:3-isopropylmalate dehydrogenase